MIGLGLASLLLWVALDRWRAGAGAVFEPLEGPLVSVYLVLVLVTAYLASRASKPRFEFRSALLVVLGFLPVLIAAGFAIDLRLDGKAAVAAWILLALYGLAVFNLHYWGFGVPFLMAGAWYLVRAYRLNQELKRVEGSGPPARSTARPSMGARPRPNKRYTPPAA